MNFNGPSHPGTPHHAYAQQGAPQHQGNYAAPGPMPAHGAPAAAPTAGRSAGLVVGGLIALLVALASLAYAGERFSAAEESRVNERSQMADAKKAEDDGDDEEQARRIEYAADARREANDRSSTAMLAGGGGVVAFGLGVTMIALSGRKKRAA